MACSEIDFKTFNEAVKRVLNGWTGYQLAIQHNSGGAHTKEKAEWFIWAISDYFAQNANLYPDEVEDFLAEILNTEFNTMLEDGSLQQVSTRLCEFFKMVQQKDYENLKIKVNGIPVPSVCNSQSFQNPNDESEESEEDEEPNLVPTQTNSMTEKVDKPEPMDDDGWTTVSRKKR